MSTNEKFEKKRRDALARKARQDAAEAARAKRYTLCVAGDPDKPIFADIDVPPGAIVKPL